MTPDAPARPAILVTGLGRCGSSLLMQMLHAAGVPCIGTYPAFEDEAFMPGDTDPARVAALSGCAVKALELHRLPTHAFQHQIVVRLTRAAEHQAKSMLKLLELLGARQNRKNLRAMVAGIRRDEFWMGQNFARAPGLRTTSMDFETLVTRPALSADRLCAFLSTHGWPDVDATAMCHRCIPRGPGCYPGFIEARLLACIAPPSTEKEKTT